VVGALAAMATEAGIELGVSSAALAQRKLAPDAALQELMIDGGQQTLHRRSFDSACA